MVNLSRRGYGNLIYINFLNSIGENNIIDISNESSGSQLDMFTPEKKELIVNHLKSNEIVYESMTNDDLKATISVS
jgi:hypothetical protein